MSHRSALAVSIALTLVLAIGILAGRDRLFAPTVEAVPSSIAPAPAISPDNAVRGPEQPVVSTEPRVIDIALPTTDQPSSIDRGDDASLRARGDDDDHERAWRDDDDEHEGYDDD